MRVEGAASYLFRVSFDEVLRLYWQRENDPLEFSHLRAALEASGVRADHPNDWGALSATLKESRVLELVGREAALVASRNAAKNGVYRLTETYMNVATFLASRRGWTRPQRERVEQGALIG